MNKREQEVFKLNFDNIMKKVHEYIKDIPNSYVKYLGQSIDGLWFDIFIIRKIDGEMEIIESVEDIIYNLETEEVESFVKN